MCVPVPPPIAIQHGKEFATLFILVACNTCNHVVPIDCHLIGSHFFEFICLLSIGRVLQVDTLDLSVRQTPLIPGQFVRRVLMPQLFRCTQQLST